MSRYARDNTAKRPKTQRCLKCKAKIKLKPRGRRPKYCSQSCRQRIYERRRWQRPAPVEALARDIAHIKVQDALMRAAVRVLRVLSNALGDDNTLRLLRERTPEELSVMVRAL